MKLNHDGSISKYKVRLVARGFLQRYGVDYNEVFAPVATLYTIRLVVALASRKNWSLSQCEVCIPEWNIGRRCLCYTTT